MLSKCVSEFPFTVTTVYTYWNVNIIKGFQLLITNLNFFFVFFVYRYTRRVIGCDLLPVNRSEFWKQGSLSSFHLGFPAQMSVFHGLDDWVSRTKWRIKWAKSLSCSTKVTSHWRKYINTFAFVFTMHFINVPHNAQYTASYV